MNKLNNSSREQVEKIIEEMSRKFSLDKSGDSYTEIPKEILNELENSSTIHLQKNIKEFTKNLPNKEPTQRTREPTVPSPPPLEEQQQAITKNANAFWKQGETTKTEARSLAIKGLRLPDSVKHLEEEPPSDKPLALGKQDVDKIFQARYEQPMLRNAVGRRQNPFNQLGKPLENNNGAQEEEAKDPNERNFKLQINLNETNKAISVFPKATVHYSIPEDDILPGERLQ
ncbi:hypothetical protein G6F55_007003 [Rhizopus delemar]|nr:hypothetical protein G6F36_011991 [Rhizopus arrhizus]KAG1455560.1 hypothetical protein G6F55_007003 [Rhizopus delemar]KAG1501898.1 hypothetical protein G6F54_002723 [Rhizopus delemar]KAG1510203.1 hypothetical protein G6F53_006858 [Rhizopus delemar]KAG1520905.1 hypothetical protein G6F52_007228 [Rhizopus delemar]